MLLNYAIEITASQFLYINRMMPGMHVF